MRQIQQSKNTTWRILLTPRWIGLFLLCCLFATICAFLSTWQFGRHDEVGAKIEHINKNYDAQPQKLSHDPTIFQKYDSDKQWTPVVMEGTYITNDQKIVRNRPRNGRPGYEQLIPFKTTDNQVVIIDRGWLPIGDQKQGRPDSVPQPPQGKLTVTARMKESEVNLEERNAPEGQIPTINLDLYAQKLSYPIDTAAYGILEEEKPSAAEMPTPLLKPSTDEGPHFSYAIQWFIFAALAFLGYFYGAYRTISNNRHDEEQSHTSQQAYRLDSDALVDTSKARHPDGSVPPTSLLDNPSKRYGMYQKDVARRSKKRSKTTQDAATEDEILDSQGYS